MKGMVLRMRLIMIWLLAIGYEGRLREARNQEDNNLVTLR